MLSNHESAVMIHKVWIWASISMHWWILSPDGKSQMTNIPGIASEQVQIHGHSLISLPIYVPSLCYTSTRFPGLSHLAPAWVCSECDSRGHTLPTNPFCTAELKETSSRVEGLPESNQTLISSVLRCQLPTNQSQFWTGERRDISGKYNLQRSKLS